jgi:hypothetical protein
VVLGAKDLIFSVPGSLAFLAFCRASSSRRTVAQNKVASYRDQVSVTSFACSVAFSVPSSAGRSLAVKCLTL